MEDVDKVDWLVDIFLEYQDSLDKQRVKRGAEKRFKKALDSDREDRSRAYNSASTMDLA
jgi:hypothetical protein